jgi:hypothetical protein
MICGNGNHEPKHGKREQRHGTDRIMVPNACLLREIIEWNHRHQKRTGYKQQQHKMCDIFDVCSNA